MNDLTKIFVVTCLDYYMAKMERPDGNGELHSVQLDMLNF